MSGRKLLIHIVIWALVCLVATTPVGALLGFVLGFAWRFLSLLLTASGANLIFRAVGGLLGLVAFVTAVLGVVALAKRDRHGAFGWWSTTIAFIGIDMTLTFALIAATRSIWGI